MERRRWYYVSGIVWVALALCGAVRADGVQRAVPPPWSAPLFKGLNFTVPGVDNVPDLHGDINAPDLVIFFAGNQYMVINDLLKAFRKAYPHDARVFAETLPPGILAGQIATGSLMIGNMRIQVRPDIFTAGLGRIRHIQAVQRLFTRILRYARNRLAIMAYRGNPWRITGLSDLARPHLRVCMPNPRWEGIARNAIIPALRNAGGEALVKQLYERKRALGETILTHVHHRETPMQVMARQCDAGVVWYTEAYFHARVMDHPTALVALPAAQNPVVTYAAAELRRAPHPKAADAFLAFLRSAVAQGIYRRYGFLPPPASKAVTDQRADWVTTVSLPSLLLTVATGVLLSLPACAAAHHGGSMARITSAWPPHEATPVAGDVASLPVDGRRNRRPSGPTLAAAARLVTLGDRTRHLPPCGDCHGPALMGGGPRIPPLAGQGAEYLTNQLRAYRQGRRAPGPLGLMGRIANRLTPREIHDVSRYIAALAPGQRPSAPRTATRRPWRPVPQDPDRFVPPPESAMPAKGPYAAALRLGEEIFDDTPHYASRFVGNVLSCRNCHLDRGRDAASMPVWAAVPRYPRYRAKSGRVVTLPMRIQGCFRFSENGRPPPADSKVMVALSAYLHWLATGLPTGVTPAGSGLAALAAPASTPDWRRGRRVYRRYCALCHGKDGQGRTAAGAQVFPPLWGPRSFNWGAGMHRIDKAAAFIKDNMPFSQGGTLTVQQAWDVAAFIDSRPRPQDPRFTGDVEGTRARYHPDGKYDAYGSRVDGMRLGAPGAIDRFDCRCRSPRV